MTVSTRPIGANILLLHLLGLENEACMEEEIHQAFGLHLKALRLSKNITQEKLSKKSGVSTGHISRIERGEKGVRVTTIRDLAIGLKVHPSALLEFNLSLKYLQMD